MFMLASYVHQVLGFLVMCVQLGIWSGLNG
jgi:hypothetical protein